MQADHPYISLLGFFGQGLWLTSINTHPFYFSSHHQNQILGLFPIAPCTKNFSIS